MRTAPRAHSPDLISPSPRSPISRNSFRGSRTWGGEKRPPEEGQSLLCLVKLAGTGTVRFVKRHNRNRQEYLLIPTLPHPFQQPNLCLASLTGEAGVSHSGLVQTARTPSAPFFPSLLTPPRLSLTGEGGFSPRRVPEQQDGLLTAVGKPRVGNYQTSYPSPASGCCCAPHRPRAHPSGAGTAVWGWHTHPNGAGTPVSPEPPV